MSATPAEGCGQTPDPFRTAEHWTACPGCGWLLGWNVEDGLPQDCSMCERAITQQDHDQQPVPVGGRPATPT